jgi:hypothetical protein
MADMMQERGKPVSIPDEGETMKTQEAATNALVKLSDEIKNAMPFSTFADSHWRIAYLHGMAFFEASAQLIAAMQFVDMVSAIIEANTIGTDAETFAEFDPIIEATIQARTELHQFTDELRAEYEYDERRMQTATFESR